MTPKSTPSGGPAAIPNMPPEMEFEPRLEPIFETVHQKQESREGAAVKISARNVFEGTIKEIKEGASTAHVLIDVKGLTVTAAITNESVEDLDLQVAKKVKVVINSSNVMVATD